MRWAAFAISEQDFGVLINILRSATVTPSLDKALVGLIQLITNTIFRGEHFRSARSIDVNAFVSFMKVIHVCCRGFSESSNEIPHLSPFCRMHPKRRLSSLG